jgi:hypothetical protein
MPMVYTELKRKGMPLSRAMEKKWFQNL